MFFPFGIKQNKKNIYTMSFTTRGDKYGICSKYLVRRAAQVDWVPIIKGVGLFL